MTLAWRDHSTLIMKNQCEHGNYEDCEEERPMDPMEILLPEVRGMRDQLGGMKTENQKTKQVLTRKPSLAVAYFAASNSL